MKRRGKGKIIQVEKDAEKILRNSKKGNSGENSKDDGFCEHDLVDDRTSTSPCVGDIQENSKGDNKNSEVDSNDTKARDSKNNKGSE